MMYCAKLLEPTSEGQEPQGTSRLGRSACSRELLEQLITEYATLVKFVASQTLAKLPDHVMIEDLISAGMIGLIDAVNKYDAGRNNKFKTDAEHRIRGEILDELRSQDTVSRSLRHTLNQLEKTVASLEKKLQRTVDDSEIAAALGVDLEDYYSREGKFRSFDFVSFDDIGHLCGSDPHEGGKDSETYEGDPDHNLQQKRIREKMLVHLGCLPKAQRAVVIKYYYEDKNFKQIGEELDLTESRVSQLHKTAIQKLQKVVKERVEA